VPLLSTDNFFPQILTSGHGEAGGQEWQMMQHCPLTAFPSLQLGGLMSRPYFFVLSTIDKTIWSVVPPQNSDARREGNDFMFAVCSESCVDNLTETLKREKEIGDLILSAEQIYKYR